MVVGSEQANCPDLVTIGKDIVKKCANVPLVIKVVASLLYGRDKNTWQCFQKCRVSEIRKDENDVMPILEFSYRHLSPSLKSCFTYCTLFPKDFVFSKEKLLDLWMAQDYVKPLDEGQNIEDAAEEYFQILARRCFFQNVENNRFDEVVSFKIHDLMHDIGQQVAGKEISIENSTTSTLGKKIRHLYDDAPHCRTQGYMVRSKIRTYLMKDGNNGSQFPVSTVIANWRSLRTLDLREVGLRSLPYTVGQLLHLRYLDFSKNCLETLPKSLTKLINLLYLSLRGCYKLKELPKDLSKLVNLKTLHVPDVLEYLPSGMAKMTHLSRLNKFIVGKRNSCLKLEELRCLRNLKGHLAISFHQDYKHAEEYCGKGGYICNTEQLNSIGIEWPSVENEEVRLGNDEEVLEDLQPHTNLKEFTIRRYPGVMMPRWAREDRLATSLPYLVEVFLWTCNGFHELPWLGRLQHLKSLTLWELKNVEYMENRSIDSTSYYGALASNSSPTVESPTILFFPSLKFLQLHEMPKLKGWWRGTPNGISENVNTYSSMLTAPAYSLPSFPRLSYLGIRICPNLMSFPLCPVVETLELFDFNEKYRVLIEEDENRMGGSNGNDLEKWSTHSIMILKSLPFATFQCLVNMRIGGDRKVERLSEFEEVFRCCSSSLHSLKISDCFKLRSVYHGGLEYLTALEELSLWNLPELRFDETEEKVECTSTSAGTCRAMPWKSLGQCLRSLSLIELEKMVCLPKAMRYLTSLTSLEFYRSPLKDIPEWIECLSSLQSLHIHDCKHLESLPRTLSKLTSLKHFLLSGCDDKLNRRCKKPDGEYWPIVKHIPSFQIKKYELFN